MIDGLEGRRSLELINAIYESVETSREVFVSFTPRQCRLGEVSHQGFRISHDRDESNFKPPSPLN